MNNIEILLVFAIFRPKPNQALWNDMDRRIRSLDVKREGGDLE